jgi:ABC-type oligopeptide transport system ATPase subunit
MASIELHDLTKHYKQGATTVKAVDGISLAIESGEFVSIVGRSGSGKTTTLASWASCSVQPAVRSC